MGLFDLHKQYRGDRLKLARLAKGMSGDEVASALNVTKQFISKLERGYPPSESNISELAEILDVESDFFFTPRPQPMDSDHCHFRSRRSRTQTLTNSILARAEILDEFIGVLEQEVVLPTLNLPDISHFPINNDDDIERVAEECRRYWGLGLGPILSMVNLVESIGIVVAHVSDVDDRVDAFTVNNVRPLIIRNSAKSSVCRFRSDIGHELGHLVLHEGIVTGDKLTEHQADHFSSAFMVPRVSFMNEFPKMRGSHFDWNALEEFKVRWRISLRMCLYRASVLGLITPEKMRKGFIYLNSKGHVSRERGDELIPSEEPGVINQAVHMLDEHTWTEVLNKSMIKSEFVKEMFSINRPVLPEDPKLVSFYRYKNFG
ncbi:ImmA/IrrE family metallo-endopeptidase [Enterobacteriaceae bacterium YMB-R22]|uniref:HTH cro/C1-type domain-containing protein n=1 Tax=Mixta intestinalis TaxID=1615494 RepID=A0A6P1PXC7_9GAMM|nr:MULTISPECIES: XRE family transcriptional regulator [Enterobacterales]MBV4413314.1 ImmA/IrrE family metallo-endopeptidase [Tenebrionicola larvae]QHM70694.1 hypothetical protein C7M51_00972 [Mixta intestinalis]